MNTDVQKICEGLKEKKSVEELGEIYIKIKKSNILNQLVKNLEIQSLIQEKLGANFLQEFKILKNLLW